MAKQKDEATQELLAAAEAVMATFGEYKNVRCVSLEKGGRVENVLSTGSLILDLILGGGFQRGRIADLFGHEGSGKTTLLQEVVASAQRSNIPVVFYDFEHSADPTYMRAQSIDLEKTIKVGRKKLPAFFYVQPEAGEDVYRHMKGTLDKMPKIDPEKPGLPTVLFAIDSFAAMFSEAEDTETLGKGGLALDARMHSLWLRRMRALLKSRGGLLVLTNQLRVKFNLRNPAMTKEDEPGGNALRFYADYKVRISAKRRSEEDKGNTKIMRQHIYLRTIKNKCFPPFREAENELVLGRGIDKAQDAVEFLKAIGKLKTPGGRHRILLKKFDAGKGMAWKDFRKLTESPKFRDFAFGLLRKEQCYAAYFKQSGYTNYSYDKQRAEDDG